MSEAGSTEVSDTLSQKYKNQQSNIEGRHQLEQCMRSTMCTTRSQPVELVVTNSTMSTCSSHGSCQGRGGGGHSQPTELVVINPAHPIPTTKPNPCHCPPSTCIASICS